MREILFRGKRTDNGEWVEGYFCRKYFPELPHDRCVIQYKTECTKEWLPDYMVAEVIPETVGQFTGLTDDKDKKIFEGDIVKHFDNSEENYDIGEIYYDAKLLMWRRTTQGCFHKSLINSYKLSSDCIYEVIGNIHDNPELLKGGAENRKD